MTGYHIRYIFEVCHYDPTELALGGKAFFIRPVLIKEREAVLIVHDQSG